MLDHVRVTLDCVGYIGSRGVTLDHVRSLSIKWDLGSCCGYIGSCWGYTGS